jgi:uncharacterized protein YndB with AHSA1/START domain
MGISSVSVDIAAPPQAVYDLYVDIGRVKEWQAGIKQITATGPLDRPGTRWRTVYGGPFRVSGEVLAVEPGVRHQGRATEMLGLVNCITTAHFAPAGAGTRLTVEFDATVAGGPFGRVFQKQVGSEMVATFGKDAARLKALAEAEAGPTS